MYCADGNAQRGVLGLASDLRYTELREFCHDVPEMVSRAELVGPQMENCCARRAFEELRRRSASIRCIYRA